MNDTPLYPAHATNRRKRLTLLLLTTLPGPGRDPISTTRATAGLINDPYDRDVTALAILNALTDAGLVEKHPRQPGKALRWRRTTAGNQRLADLTTGSTPDRPAPDAPDSGAGTPNAMPGSGTSARRSTHRQQTTRGNHRGAR